MKKSEFRSTNSANSSIYLLSADIKAGGDKMDNQNNEIQYEKSPRLGDYEGIYFKRDGVPLLELRVSGTALVNAPCNLREVNIYNWLYETGLKHIEKAKSFEIVTLLAADIIDQKLITDWDSLRREPTE